MPNGVGAYHYSMYPPFIREIAHDQNNLYLATTKGLVVMDKNDFSQTLHTPGYVYSVALHDGVLWFGQENGWMTAISEGNTYSFQIDVWPKGYMPDNLQKIAFSNTGKMFLAKMDFLFVVEDEKVVDYYQIPFAVAEEMISDMEFDSTGALWISSQGGVHDSALCCYTDDYGLWFVLKSFPCSEFSGGTNSLAVDKDDNVWFEAQGRLMKFDGRTFTTVCGGNAAVLDFDDNGVLWGLASKGYLRAYEGDSWTDYYFTLGEKEEAHCMDIDGDTIYVGTNKRLLVFHDGQFASVEIAPEATGIQDVDTDKKSENGKQTFNLAGQQTSRSHKGLKITKGTRHIEK
ncbi:MAG: hypothetical protein J6Z14_11830 [Prevotella sp.]|nr:hypothetical protein [Prevotella sp.]